MYSGSEFQMEEAVAGKARLPTVEFDRRLDETIWFIIGHCINRPSDLDL